MSKLRFVYVPNPAHKVETTEIGPPRWMPYKEKCPPGMTIAEREKLLDESVAEDGSTANARRYALRRTEQALEFFESKLTRALFRMVQWKSMDTQPGACHREFLDDFSRMA